MTFTSLLNLSNYKFSSAHICITRELRSVTYVFYFLKVRNFFTTSLTALHVGNLKRLGNKLQDEIINNLRLISELECY